MSAALKKKMIDTKLIAERRDRPLEVQLVGPGE